jgi:hypothetical protein
MADAFWAEIDRLLDADQSQEAAALICRDFDVEQKAWLAANSAVAGIPKGSDARLFFDSVSAYVVRCLAPSVIAIRKLQRKLAVVEGRLEAAEKRADRLTYRGVWRGEIEDYEENNLTTWGGSLWIATHDCPGKPGEPDSGWKLCVKAGSKGRDGTNGEPGRPGRDADSKVQELEAKVEARFAKLEARSAPRALPALDRSNDDKRRPIDYGFDDLKRSEGKIR